MRFFKRLAEVEKQVDELFKRIAKLTGHFVTVLKTINALNEAVIALSDENKELKAELEAIKERLPEYEEAVAKGVVEKWDAGVRAIADFDPAISLNKPEVLK